MFSFVKDVWKLPGRITIGLICLLLIRLLLPIATVSGDNGASWSEMHDIVNYTLDYIAKNHPEAPSAISNGGSWSLTTVPARDCIGGYRYTSGKWVITICCADRTSDTFNIRAVCDNPGIAWSGFIKNGKISEIDYSNPSLKQTPAK